MPCLAYHSGYKYQLVETFTLPTPVRPGRAIDLDYLSLELDGTLTIKRGYAWDGPSGPTFDTLNFMRGALVHDALYQLMREGHLDRGIHREPADRLLQSLCIEDGMSKARAWLVYQGVHRFGDPAADPAHDRPVLRAPEGCTD
jgi:hypothetical protein